MKDSHLSKRPIKLGFDAKWYFSGPPSGIVVVRNIIDQFLQIERGAHVYLFIKEKEKKQFENLVRTKFCRSKVELITVRGSNNFLQNLFLLPWLVRRYKIDIMVYQSFIPLFYYKTRKSKNIAFITDILDVDYPQYFGRIEKLVYRFRTAFLHKVDHVITISYSEKERIVKHTGIPENKVSVVYLGVNESFRVYTNEECNSLLQKYSLPEKYILYIGRLNIRKNIPTLLEAMKYVSNDWPLVLIGPKDYKSFDIDSKIQELGINEKVIFLGYIPEKDLAGLLSSASIFCFPSFAEGFGLPPLEAMKSGTPVITTNTTSIPEVCGDAALYFNADSPRDLSEKIDLLIHDKELADSLINKGLKRAKQFTWENSVSEFLNILKQL